jgi:hypothetical protein
MRQSATPWPHIRTRGHVKRLNGVDAVQSERQSRLACEESLAHRPPIPFDRRENCVTS